MKTSIKRLAAICKSYPRLAIAGYPRAGKTTLAKALDAGPNVLHADDLMHLGWSEASAELAKIVNDHDGPLIVEGMAVPRALRKGMRVDAVLWLDKPHEQLKPGHVSMGKGAKTVLNEWRSTNPGVDVLTWEHDET